MNNYGIANAPFANGTREYPSNRAQRVADILSNYTVSGSTTEISIGTPPTVKNSGLYFDIADEATNTVGVIYLKDGVRSLLPITSKEQLVNAKSEITQLGGNMLADV